MSIQPTVIRDITLQRWSWDGRYFLCRDRDPMYHAGNPTPLFVPEQDVLRFAITDWFDRPKGQTQADYHAAIKFSEPRLRALKIHHRIFVCDCCGQYAGDCSSRNDSTRCLACSKSSDEWRDGDILRNEPLPTAPDCEVQA